MRALSSAAAAAAAASVLLAVLLLALCASPALAARAAPEGEPRIVERPLRLPGAPERLLSAGEGEDGKNATTPGDAAGYFKLSNTRGGHMFYQYFRSRLEPELNETEVPVVLWMTGGPGCSSQIALFYENGPWTINDDMTLKQTEFGWDQVSHLIYVDQPLGTGFSYAKNPLDWVFGEKRVADDMYDFVQQFLTLHPELAHLPFYVTGESYAGHYVPAVGARIQHGIDAGEGLRVNLKGVAIGNGLTVPVTQYQAYADYGLMTGMISNETHAKLAGKWPKCERMIKKCRSTSVFDRVNCLNAVNGCQEIPETILNECAERRGKVCNVYDIRNSTGCPVPPLCYDFTNADKYLNLPETREALGVGNRKWVSCSPGVHRNMMTDWMRSYEGAVQVLLSAKRRVLVYAGEDDFICNYLGNFRWVREMKWYGQEDFNQGSMQPFLVDGVEGKPGTGKEFGPLAYLRLKEAGHMVPMDQPRVSLEMLRRFITGEPMFEAPGDVATA